MTIMTRIIHTEGIIIDISLLNIYRKQKEILKDKLIFLDWYDVCSNLRLCRDYPVPAGLFCLIERGIGFR